MVPTEGELGHAEDLVENILVEFSDEADKEEIVSAENAQGSQEVLDSQDILL